MPLYEYVCRSCGNAFEELVYGDRAVACPSCKAGEVEKVMSTFAVGRSASGGGNAGEARSMGCGGCGDPRGPGACRMN